MSASRRAPLLILTNNEFRNMKRVIISFVAVVAVLIAVVTDPKQEAELAERTVTVPPLPLARNGQGKNPNKAGSGDKPVVMDGIKNTVNSIINSVEAGNGDAAGDMILAADGELLAELSKVEGQLVEPSVGKYLLLNWRRAQGASEAIVARLIGRLATAEFIRNQIAIFGDEANSVEERRHALVAIAHFTSPESERELMVACEKIDSPELLQAAGEALVAAPSAESLTYVVQRLEVLERSAPADSRRIAEKIGPFAGLLNDDLRNSFFSRYPEFRAGSPTTGAEPSGF